MPRLIAPRRRSTTPITSPSSSIITAGGSASRKARRNTTMWKNGLPRVRSSPCRPSPWKATPTARRTRSPAPTPTNSPANIRTGPFRAASGTICRKKRRAPLPKRSSMSPKSDRRSTQRGGARIESAPENRGAPINVQQSCLRRLLLNFDSLAVVADRDRARLLGLGDLAHQVDVQETVLEARAFHLDEIGELEHALKSARRDALIEHLAAVAFVLGVFLAADGQRVLFGYDGQLRLIEARDRDGNAVRILAGPLDIVGRIAGSGALEALIEQREQPVEADGGTIKGS